MIQLRGNTETQDRRLDRIYELDWNSLRFLSGPSTGDYSRKPRSYTYRLDVWLDQGQEGACVGFDYGHELAAFPAAVAGLSNAYAREQLYWRFQKEDPWEGGAYPGATPFMEGTSVLTGAKVLKDLGYYTEYRWGITALDVAHHLGYDGPSPLGLNWYTGMFDTDEKGFIRPTGRIEGGHAILAIGVKIAWKHWYNRFVSSTWDNVDLDKSYVILHNSWGQGWGVNGRAKLSLADLDKLMVEQGEACFPKRNSALKQVVYL